MVGKVNKTSGETTTYIYDAENKLVGVTSPGSNVTYKYDALGRRIEKNVNGNITKYVYNGEDIIQEYDGANNIIASYIHGSGIDEPISTIRYTLTAERYFYLSDGLGSITAITDASGTTVNTYRYDSFGNILTGTGSLNQPYSYTGREYDAETGLFYYRARYYDAKIGRFLQEDPVWGYNLYGYCFNNPINFFDPSGLNTVSGGPFNANDWFRENFNNNYKTASEFISSVATILNDISDFLKCQYSNIMARHFSVFKHLKRSAEYSEAAGRELQRASRYGYNVVDAAYDEDNLDNFSNNPNRSAFASITAIKAATHTAQWKLFQKNTISAATETGKAVFDAVKPLTLD